MIDAPPAGAPRQSAIRWEFRGIGKARRCSRYARRPFTWLRDLALRAHVQRPALIEPGRCGGGAVKSGAFAADDAEDEQVILLAHYLPQHRDALERLHFGIGNMMLATQVVVGLE
jgi:hypothetical protein